MWEEKGDEKMTAIVEIAVVIICWYLRIRTLIDLIMILNQRFCIKTHVVFDYQ